MSSLIVWIIWEPLISSLAGKVNLLCPAHLLSEFLQLPNCAPKVETSLQPDANLGLLGKG